MIPGAPKRVFSFHDLLMYLALGRKHLRLMLLLMCLVACGGLIFYTFKSPVYYSKSLIQVHYVARPLDTEKLYQDGRISAVIAGLGSGPVLERTAKALGVDASIRDIRLDYLLKWSFHAEDGNIQLELWPTSMDWARRAPEIMVREFLAYRQERRLEERQKIVDTYTKEMESMAGKMDETLDAKFEKADEQNVTRTMIELAGVRGVPAELIRITSLIDEMGRVQLKLQDPGLDVVAKLSLISSLQGKANVSLGQSANLSVGQEVSTEPPAGAPMPGEPVAPDERAVPAAPPAATSKTEVVVIPSMVAPEETWRTLEKRREDVRAQIHEKSAIYLPGHFKMVALQKQLGEVERQLGVELRLAQNRLSLEYQNLLNRRQEFEAKIPEYEAINKKALKVNRETAIYDSTRMPWTSFYVEMKRRLEALDYASERERIDLTFGGMLDVKDRPVSPNRSKVFLLSLAIGLLLATSVPFLIEYLDHTLTNLDQVESTFQLRALGIVPKLADSNRTSALAVPGGPEETGTLVENFRVIRTNILSMGSFSKPPHVLMVTSAMPREGKTVVSSNLAISFAQTGARTLLVDTDLRRGRMHRLFGYRKSPGLSNVLLGENTLEEACRPTVHENLSILSAGKHLNSGTELLGSSLFSDLMARLRGKYDRIVIDTPPVLGLSETSIMQPHVDGAVFVIWSGRTPIRNMKVAIEMLQANGANFYGFVLNRLDLNATTNYYQYYYYSHDYYYHNSLELENA